MKERGITLKTYKYNDISYIPIYKCKIYISIHSKGKKNAAIQLQFAIVHIYRYIYIVS